MPLIFLKSKEMYIIGMYGEGDFYNKYFLYMFLV